MQQERLLQPPDLSVVIVSWNAVADLERCLRSVQAQTDVAMETFVVDNASTDGSARMVQHAFPGVRLIENQENRGFAAACNQGLRVAAGRHLLLLNPDTIVPAGTFAATVAYLDRQPDVGILGCALQHADGRRQRSVLRFPTLASQLLVLLKVQAFTQRPRALRRYYALDFDYAREADVDQVMGSFFAFRRAVLEQLGFLDEGFYIWLEEVDYCKRAVTAGWRVRYTPTIRVTHIGGTSQEQLPSRKRQRIFNSSLLHYFRKYRPGVPVLLLRCFIVLNMLLASVEDFARRFYAPKPVR